MDTLMDLLALLAPAAIGLACIVGATLASMLRRRP
jgi:hypothetical protein